jgi:purine-binding chemotaxis protein CheW
MVESERYLILSLDSESFAMPIESILEITVPRSVRKNQQLPDIFEGTVDYRGAPIPVLNLKKLLKLSGKPGGNLLVLKSKKGLLGLLADSASELLQPKESPAAIPAGVLDRSINYYAGILRNRDELILLLNAEGLVP